MPVLAPAAARLAAPGGGGGRASWSARCRAIEEPHRDGLGDHRAGRRRGADGQPRSATRCCRRVIEEAPVRNVARFHAACSDVPENMELFGQLSFMAYAQEEIYYRPPEARAAPLLAARRVRARGHKGNGHPDHETPDVTLQPAARPTRGTSSTCGRTPPRRRSRASRITRRPGLGVGRPRGRRAAQQPEPAPALLRRQRLAPARGAARRRLLAARQPAGRGRTTCGSWSATATDGASFLRSVLEAMGSEALAAGILSPVRTYESTGQRRPRWPPASSRWAASPCWCATCAR